MRASRALAAILLPAALLAGFARAADRPTAVVSCASCHAEPSQWEKSRSSHPPAATGDCLSCHNAHASRHGTLLRREEGRLCLSCHQDLAVRLRSGTKHAALLAESPCLSCHEPHAGDRAHLLKNDTAALCGACHENVATEARVSHPHPPVTGGDCLACHDPHGSEGPALARRQEPALCSGCHSLSTPAIATAHRGIPVASARCTACHASHGSAKKGILRGAVHPPFADGSCETCHTDPKAAPASLRAAGAQACLECHEPRAKGHPIPAAGEGACLSCHDPHASGGAALLRGREGRVCLSCHSEIATHREISASVHPTTGSSPECTSCHALHLGLNPQALGKQDAHQTCAACHATHAEFSHPMGEGVADPSHPGQWVGCLSCHDPHGTPFPQMLLADPRQDLCVRCHQGGGAH